MQEQISIFLLIQDILDKNSNLEPCADDQKVSGEEMEDLELIFQQSLDIEMEKEEKLPEMK